MRLSGLVLASILLISTAFSQRSSSGSAGAGHSSFSGGSSSAAASHASSAGSSRGVSSSSGEAARSRSLSSAKGSATAKSPDHSLASLFHHKRPEPQPASQRTFFIPRCRRGGNCGVCPGGSRNTFGQCVYKSQSCVAGQVWNGLGCGWPYYLSNCSNLAQQVFLMDRWQNQRDSSWAWRRPLLLQQYQECLMRYGANPFGVYALNGLSPFDIP